MQVTLLKKVKIGDKIFKKGHKFTLSGVNWGGYDGKYYYYVNGGDKIDINDAKLSSG